ncbi:MAG: single-stranded-DNA-specific exonuclease RecJ [Anaerolineales bacterium]|jgi:single-stranded-DNA-specific exonuclease
MNPTLKRWQIDPEITPEADLALQNFDPILRQILFNRGYATEAETSRFLLAIPDFDTDPFQLKDMHAAVERITTALQEKEAMAIYGDYDVDGVSATALLVLLLQALGGQVQGYIPNRFEEGYGVNKEALTTLQSQAVRLVITVDCGIRSLPEAEHAHHLGLDLIITDHHHPSDELPIALAIINPKQPLDPYRDKDLAGVGLAYKLGDALLQHLRKIGYPVPQEVKIEDYLDLVALGTVADLAPLVGENRAIVRAGLKVIQTNPRQGMHSLMGVAGVKADKIVASDIGFMLGPRLNAAGRLESALASLDLLTTSSIAEAGLLAQQLDNQNRERQKVTQIIQAQAETLALAQDPQAFLLLAADPDFNPGVIGLAASRLTDLYYRPAIVAYQGQEFTRGSCRSIPEFHITDALDQCADLLEHHGGHAAAAGFTVRNERLPELFTRLQKIAHQKLSQLPLTPTLHADIEVSLSDLQPSLLDELEGLQPTGYGNPQATFVSRNLKVTGKRAVGRDGAHLKLTVTNGHVTFDAIAFRQGGWFSHLPERVDLLYTFEKNEYNGWITLQLNVRDIKPAGTPD